MIIMIMINEEETENKKEVISKAGLRAASKSAK